jgi:hypothetical protein
MTANPRPTFQLWPTGKFTSSSKDTFYFFQEV